MRYQGLADESRGDDAFSGRYLRRDEESPGYSQLQAIDEDEDEDDWFDDEDDLRNLVHQIAEDNSNIDEDAPTLPAEKGARPKRADYVFCPLSHRLAIMRLFAKHASQHSLLPERHGQARSPHQIHRDAVSEMYHHCKANNLCEVWAYLWNSWYRKSRWVLWARSAYAASIPCKRTTMVVEALWRNLKRLVLQMYNRPPVDLAVHAVITQSIPAYRLTLHNIVHDSRSGRAATLSHFQESLKHAWTKLSTVAIRGTYITDLATFTCDCGAQKYHSHLLCKHLVQAAGPQSPYWWPDVLRYHIPPFYRVPASGTVPRTPEKLRNHAWLSRMPNKDPLPPPSTPLSSEAARVISIEDSDSDSDPDAVHIPSEVESPVSSRRSSVSIMSSPDKAPPTGRDGLMRTRAGGGGGFELDNAEELETDEAIRLLTRHIELIQDARNNPDDRFLKRAKRAMSGTSKFVRNVESYANRRTMPKTNARGKEGQAATDVIGYRHKP
ncbi:hypothetical protein OH76DRAFT_1475946 [Lentinus brumalis]|uniref:SWIM-type domain-containing protein n=1 Tax=Lentinus brumalis TaxID=2498619 RepID=A0A371CLE1_9APHY|nr:hypothetical protein OH76DRAFT_1475946 [Polyporus brumalis]